MTRTSNLKLPQFAAGDPIQRLDFNDAFSKIDKGCGNARITWGSYTGTGKYGADNPNTITPGFRVQILYVFNSSLDDASALGFPFMLIRPFSKMVWGDENVGSVTWGDTSVSWYNDDALHQLNEAGRTWFYIAIGA